MIRRRLRNAELDPDVRDEIASHIEMRAQLNQERGMSREDAYRAARAGFGNATIIEEDVRAVHINTVLGSFIQDLRYGARGLRRSPVFAITAIFAAALGIGSSTAVFSVVDRILFRSLPYPQEDRLVSLGMMAPLDTNEFLFPESYFDWRRAQRPFESVTSFIAGTADCDLTEANPVRLGCAHVEGNFVSTLGTPPLLGRNFTVQEDLPGGPKAALMSYPLWRGRFGGDAGIVGKTISLDGQPVVVAGILPANFEMPTLARADLLLPEQLNEATDRNGRALRVFARLKPGITVAQAYAGMQPLFNRALNTVPAAFRKEVRFRIRPLRDRQVQDARLASWVLLAAVGAVLLIACANIANLLLARSTARQREFAVRAALGAGCVRLMRQALTESMLLAILGGAAGYAFAWTLLRLFTGIAPAGIMRLEEATLDARVLLFAVAGSMLSGIIFGVAPALQPARAGLLAGSRSSGIPRTVFRELLVAAQIAVSVVLLTGAGMLLRSLWKLENVPLGIEAEHVVTAEFTLAKQRYAGDARVVQFFNELESRIRRIPGAQAAAISDSIPPYGGTRARPFAAIQVDGKPAFAEGTGGMVMWRYVSPQYFAALRIPIVRGRPFSDADCTAPDQKVILSESLARRLYANGDAIGGHLLLDGGATVVGIAANIRDGGPLQRPAPEYYMVRRAIPDAIFRNQEPGGGWRHAFVIIRSSLGPAITTDWIRRELGAIDPAMPVTFSTMHERAGKLSQRARFNAFLLAIFAAMGVLLAAIGLYGVMAFLTGQRTAEIGIRMALGATPGQMSRSVLSHAARWTTTGAAAGLIGSLIASRMLKAMLFNVPQNDPWTYGAVLALLVLIALAAAWIPSRRAAAVDPMKALRHE